jgi:CheY-like chemotaxis protein/HPt (histidine-containing phosphotransfer) domain-containing protein
VAEDNVVNQQVARGLLGRDGHGVTIVETGRAALEAVQREAFDAVLMDLHMPEMGGIEATRAIRALDGPASSVPIIAATAGAMDHEIRACLEAGMNAAVAKPIEPRVLARALADAVGLAACEAAAFASDDEEDEPDASALLDSGTDPFEPALIDRLIAQLGPEFAQEMADDFAAAAEEALGEIDGARRSGDAVAWTEAAHKLKSGAGAVGLRRVWRLAESIEQDAEAGDIDGAGAASDALRDAIGQGRALLADHLQRTTVD